MASVNKVILIGNLGKDPELKYAGEMAICNFSLATTKKVKGENKTSWHNITMFGKTAELAKQYLTKGSPVYIEGEIDYQSWEDKDGTRKYKTVIIGNAMQFFAHKPSGEQNQYAQNNEPLPTPPPQDDLPF